MYINMYIYIYIIYMILYIYTRYFWHNPGWMGNQETYLCPLGAPCHAVGTRAAECCLLCCHCLSAQDVISGEWPLKIPNTLGSVPPYSHYSHQPTGEVGTVVKCFLMFPKHRTTWCSNRKVLRCVLTASALLLITLDIIHKHKGNDESMAGHILGGHTSCKSKSTVPLIVLIRHDSF